MIRTLLPKRVTPPFPPYSAENASPIEHAVHAFDQWAKRILTLVALLGLLFSVASYAGWKQFGPAARIDSLTTSMVVVRDTGLANSRRLDAVERDGRTNLYIGCELLRQSQPNAIPLEQCSDAQQRLRRGRLP